mgnify:FL=1
MTPDFVMVSDRPEFIKMDDRGRPHCDDGPYCRWRDGWSLYYWHGVRVNKLIIEHPEQVTVKMIEEESNTEVRRVMIEKYGQEKYLLDSKATEIHRDDWGILYKKEMPNDEPLVMIKVVNSTPEPDGYFKDYFLRVPPTIKRAREAVAWTFGKNEKDYILEKQT